jgi:hypothetical protein
MDVLWLPVIWPNDTLDNVLAAIDSAGRSAAVVQQDDGYELVWVGSVLEAQARGAVTLAQVTDREPVHVADVSDAAMHGVDLVRPLRTPAQYEHLLDKVSCAYAVVAHAHQTALVVTQHEGQTAEASHANRYYCDGASTHFFPKPVVGVGQPCPKCVGAPKGTIALKR